MSVEKRQYYFDQSKGMGIIVKTVTRLTVGIVFLFGINVALKGHLVPGGGVAGGGAIALALLSLILAFGKETALKNINRKRITMIATLGMMMFLFLGLIGLIGGNLFSTHFMDNEGKFGILKANIIPLFNIAICLLVGSGVYTIFITLIMLQVRKGSDK
ncbi:MAG: hypothetical protein KAS13_05790 [Candidatus Omnitrophica bacterium]|nr:hypothetical protein [Candidatus Omnitrophota bacterium]